MAKKPGRGAIEFRYSNGSLYPNIGKKGNISEAERRSRVETQARNIINKFGTAAELCRALKFANPDPKDHWNESSVYRWTYPREKGGSGGEIPPHALRAVLRAARYSGIVLTLDDLYPNLV